MSDDFKMHDEFDPETEADLLVIGVKVFKVVGLCLLLSLVINLLLGYF